MRLLREYLSTKVAKASIIYATDNTIQQIVRDELDRLSYDADLNHIDVSKVTFMSGLFSCGKGDYLGTKYNVFNPDISRWDVSNVKDMRYMFFECKKFNCDISEWDVSKVEDMDGMFNGCENFDCDISEWDVRNVKDMTGMFLNCKKFNQDLSGWDVKDVKYRSSIFLRCPIREEYKPKFKK